jgi:AcrR family transcriptional regulator
VTTRKERQTRTRELLMESAATVAARRGIERASLDEVAERAGFTKGAIYANFSSKEELFLAMLDAHFEARLEELDRIVSTEADPDAQAREAAQGLMRMLDAQPEHHRLFFEFAVHAARNEDFREQLVARYRSLRERLADLLAERVERLGIDPVVPPADVAAMAFAMANGMALERLLEPEAVPDTLFGEMIATFFIGLRARAGVPPPPEGRT